MALLDLVPPALNLVADHGRLLDKERAARQQLEQMRLCAGNCGEELPAGKDGHALCFGEICDCILFAICILDALAAQARMNRGEQFFAGWNLRQRQEQRFIESGGRALRLRIELAHRFDFVAEEIHAYGTIRFRRIDIQYAAASGELPRHFNQIDLRIADAGQVVDQHADVDFFAALELQGQASVVAARKEPQRDRFHGNDDDGCRAGDELPQHGRALLLDIRMRREIFKRQDIVCRQTQHALGIDGPGELAAGAESEFKRFSGLIVRHDDDDRLFRGACEKRDVQRAGGCGQSRDTPAPRSKAEMPAYAIECGGLLQLREDFADKREDHD